jgi:hypothetical protein
MAEELLECFFIGALSAAMKKDILLCVYPPSVWRVLCGSSESALGG